MRRPIADPLAWWRAAKSGKRPTIDMNDPQPGWYKRRMVRHGPWCGVKIWLDQPICPETGELIGDAILCCDINGKATDPESHWLSCCLHPVSEEEYEYLRNLSVYAKARDPREPLAEPRKPIDLLTAPPPEFTKRRRRP